MNLPPHKQTMNLLILLDHNILFNPLTRYCFQQFTKIQIFYLL
jgi:hypothetical protein